MIVNTITIVTNSLLSFMKKVQRNMEGFCSKNMKLSTYKVHGLYVVHYCRLVGKKTASKHLVSLKKHTITCWKPTKLHTALVDPSRGRNAIQLLALALDSAMLTQELTKYVQTLQSSNWTSNWTLNLIMIVASLIIIIE